MKSLLIVALLVAVAQGRVTPGIQTPENARAKEGRIIGGQPAVLGQFPHQIHLTASGSGGGWTCGGSLISRRWVLTAAHCLQGASSTTIRFGININSPVLTVSTNRLIIHPQYNSGSLNNDIGLIDLQTDVELSDNVKVITIPRRSQMSESFADRISTVSGYGQTANIGGASSTLNWVNLDVISNQACQDFYGPVYIIASTICTRTTGKSTCFGDSGGPMIIRDENEGIDIQIGVVSFVSGGGCTAGPAGYVRPHHYWQWINENTGIPIRE